MKQLDEQRPTLVIVGPCRFSYLNVFKPRHNDTRNVDEYSAVLMFPKVPTERITDPLAEITAVAKVVKLALSEKFGATPPKVWTNCFKDGDKELNGEGEPKYPGCWFISTRCDAARPPVLIDGERKPVTGGWESGDWGVAKISFYGYDKSGNKGVSSSLRAIQFLYRDEHFGSASDPEAVANEFDAVANADKTTTATPQASESGDAYDPFADE